MHVHTCAHMCTHTPTCKCTYMNVQTHTRNNVREKGLLWLRILNRVQFVEVGPGVMEFVVLRTCGPDFVQGGRGQEQRKLDQDRRWQSPSRLLSVICFYQPGPFVKDSG